MSSPPASRTSHKTVTLSHGTRRHNQRSSSFPSFDSLYSFRRKPPEPSNARTSSERIEVAPSIFSTDATAKVFGYLDNKAQKKPEPATSPVKKLIDRYKEAWKDDGTDDFRTRTHKRHVEAFDRARQEKRDDAKRQTEENEKRGRRGRRMRTVSKDDELIERGANPRTGLVSPFVLSDSNSDSANSGYVAEGHRLADRGRRGGSGKWKQQSQGWRLVDSPLSSNIIQSVSENASGAVSVAPLEDKPIVETPGVDNPTTMQKIDEQIRRYQASIRKTAKYARGSHAMVHPDTLPSLTTKRPEGTSTSPTKLQKIQRKEVGSSSDSGSGRSLRNNYTDTVVESKSVHASSMLTPRKDTGEQKVRTNTPNGNRQQAPSSDGSTQAQGYPETLQDSSGQSRPGLFRTAITSSSQQIPSTNQAITQRRYPRTTYIDPPASLAAGLRHAVQYSSDVYRGWVSPDQYMSNSEATSVSKPFGSDEKANAIPKQRDIMPPCTCQPYKAIQADIRADRARMSPRLMLGNPNTMRDPASQMRNRAVYIRIDGDSDDQIDTENPRQRLRSRTCEKSHKADDHGLSKETGGVKGPFAYHFAGAEEKPPNSQLGQVNSGRLGRRASFAIKIDNMKRFAEKIDLGIHPATVIEYIQLQLHSMFQHVLITLYPSSPAVRILRMSNSNREEYLLALKDVVLACVYLLILFNLVRAVGNGLRVVMSVFHCIWFPLQTIIAVVKWCVVK